MKKNKKITGNALSQYSIIIVLVGLALVPVFFVTGQYLFKNFESFSSLLKGNQVETKPIITPKPNDTSKASDSNQTTEAPQQQSHSQAQIKTTSNNNGISDKIAAGQHGGTPDNPVKKCSNGSCTIDYGDFVLNGIPEDFGSFVEASGTSGGTEVFATTLDQIADQLEEEGDGAGEKDFRDLANFGHFLGRYSKSIESKFQNCGKDGTIATCLGNKREINPNGGYKSDYSYELSNPDKLKDFNLENINDVSAYNSYKYIVSQMNKYNEKILNNDKYSNNMKGISQLCLSNIINLNTNLESIIYENTMKNGSSHLNKSYINETVFYPKETHLNSSFICKTGYNKDNGYQCRK